MSLNIMSREIMSREMTASMPLGWRPSASVVTSWRVRRPDWQISVCSGQRCHGEDCM
jgi:hypothetical protein